MSARIERPDLNLTYFKLSKHWSWATSLHCIRGIKLGVLRKIKESNAVSRVQICNCFSFSFRLLGFVLGEAYGKEYRKFQMDFSETDRLLSWLTDARLALTSLVVIENISGNNVTLFLIKFTRINIPNKEAYPMKMKTYVYLHLHHCCSWSLPLNSVNLVGYASTGWRRLRGDDCDMVCP